MGIKKKKNQFIVFELKFWIMKLHRIILSLYKETLKDRLRYICFCVTSLPEVCVAFIFAFPLVKNSFLPVQLNTTYPAVSAPLKCRLFQKAFLNLLCSIFPAYGLCSPV